MTIAILISGLATALSEYIPKGCIEKHIVMEMDPDDTRF